MSRSRISAALLTFLCALGANAMDGMVISNIISYATYRWEFTPGKLVRYDIADNYVTRVDTLPVDTGNAPVINKSGTYFAYLTNHRRNPTDYFSRSLVFRPVDGSSQKIEVPVVQGAVWLWWSSDGSIYYTVNDIVNNSMTGQHTLRKLTLSKNGSQLVATDRCWARLGSDVAIQGGFVGLDDSGTKFAYSSNGPWTGGAILDGDSTKALVNSLQGQGCGWSVSPSGTYFIQWVGGHSMSTWFRWDTPVSAMTVATFFPVLNSTWAVYRDSDPESKLEVSTDGGTTWKPSPVGAMGQDNMFAVNSDYWHLCEIGIAWAETDAYGVNMIALNWKDSIAINVTKIMPFSAQPSSRNRFRGVTFTGVDRYADRGSLWVSNREDVNAPLQHFVDDRQTDNLYWSNLLGLPPANIGSSVVHARQQTPPAARGLSICRIDDRYVAQLPSSGDFRADVYDLSGKQIGAPILGRGSVAQIPIRGAGTCVIRVQQAGRQYAASFVAL